MSTRSCSTDVTTNSNMSVLGRNTVTILSYTTLFTHSSISTIVRPLLRGWAAAGLLLAANSSSSPSSAGPTSSGLSVVSSWSLSSESEITAHFLFGFGFGSSSEEIPKSSRSSLYLARGCCRRLTGRLLQLKPISSSGSTVLPLPLPLLLFLFLPLAPSHSASSSYFCKNICRRIRQVQ
ncbi:hypothetical protein E2C01_011892 [Portunus trituberculatus]|uniref:Uncharacterized protein n=1 Tax=Portunus trituberculatus TaxID=210409 RepID=A0A5B7DCA8_PORTR|nr:hypothetical protein [Portunus trituberculatus]